MSVSSIALPSSSLNAWNFSRKSEMFFVVSGCRARRLAIQDRTVSNSMSSNTKTPRENPAANENPLCSTQSLSKKSSLASNSHGESRTKSQRAHLLLLNTLASCTIVCSTLWLLSSAWRTTCRAPERNRRSGSGINLRQVWSRKSKENKKRKERLG